MAPVPVTRTDHALRDDLRHRMRAQRHRLDAPARLAAAEAVRHHLDQWPLFAGATRVAGYWAIGGELPLNLVLSSLAARGQRYCLPRLRRDNTLQFITWSTGDAVAPNRYGIPEPVDGETFDPSHIDVVLLPLLAFDRHGARLGSGAGYYDRTFEFLARRTRPAQPLLVGVAYAMQEVEALPTAAWDIPLDGVVTERALIHCHTHGEST